MRETHEEFVRAPLLTVAEAARHLGVGRKVIYRLIEEGRIVAVKAGAATRIEKASLEAFKAGREIT